MQLIDARQRKASSGEQTYTARRRRAAAAPGRDRPPGQRGAAHRRRRRAPMPAAPLSTTQAAAYDALPQGRLLAGAAYAGRTSPGHGRFRAGHRSRSGLRAGAGRSCVGAHLRVVYGYRSEADPYTEAAQALQPGRTGREPATPAPPKRGCARADARSIAFYPEDSVRADVVRALRLMPNSPRCHGVRLGTLPRGPAPDSRP